MGCGASHPVAPDALPPAKDAAADANTTGSTLAVAAAPAPPPPPSKVNSPATGSTRRPSLESNASSALDPNPLASEARRGTSTPPPTHGHSASPVPTSGVPSVNASPTAARSHLGQSREARDAASSSSGGEPPKAARRPSQPSRLGDGGSPSRRPGSSGSAKSGGGGSSLAGLGSRSRSKANVMERRSLDELDLPRERPPEREKQRSHSIDSGMEGSLRCAAAHVPAFSAVAPGAGPFAPAATTTGRCAAPSNCADAAPISVPAATPPRPATR